jgi:hypothetical protein
VFIVVQVPSLNTNLHDLLADTIKASELVGVPCNEEAVWRIIEAYGDRFSDSSLAFRTTTHPQHQRDLSLRYTNFFTPHDPYAIAVENGFLVEEGHPLEKLASEAQARFPIFGQGIDISVRNGLEKIWPWFRGRMPIEQVAALPSIPKAVGDHIEYFKKYDLTGAILFALDFRNKTMNVYFLTPPGTYTAEQMGGMIGDLGFEVPSQEELQLNTTATFIYHTFRWDSPQVERLCYVLSAPAEAMPTHLDPVIERFVNGVPRKVNPGFFTYNTTYARRGDYFKVEADYTGILGHLFGFVMEELMK